MPIFLHGQKGEFEERSIREYIEYISLLFADWLILQAPYPIFEGDDVILRCPRREESTSETVFYKNERKISSNYESSFTLTSVSRDHGKYHCSASKKSFWGTKKENSKPLMIQVQGNGSPLAGLSRETVCRDPGRGSSVKIS